MAKQDINISLILNAVEDAFDSVGIYPASISKQNEDGEWETKERTEWQDGWNACHLKSLDKIYDQLEKIREEIDENFALLSIIDAGWFLGDKFRLNMNDTFFYACADEEVITKEEAKEVVSLFKTHGFKGIDYWVAEKRGYDPEIPHYKEQIELVRQQELKGKEK